MQDSLVVEEGLIVKFPLVTFAPCLLPLQLQLPGSFQQEEVKQPNWRDTQRPSVMNYRVPPEAPDHLPLFALPCLPEYCSHCATVARTSHDSKAFLNTCWWSMEPAVPRKYCKTYTWPR